MQYLIRCNLRETLLWRLIALEGMADLAHAAKLIALSFAYPEAFFYFEANGRKYRAGCDGKAASPAESASFDSLQLKAGDKFLFTAVIGSAEKSPEKDRDSYKIVDSFADDSPRILLVHECTVFKAEPKLYCLIPSTLIGANKLADDGRQLTIENINAYIDECDVMDPLNLKECTLRMRALGSVRAKPLHESLVVPYQILQ